MITACGAQSRLAQSSRGWCEALTFRLDIVSAEALILSGPASQVIAPGLARLANQFDQPQELFVSSGCLEVLPYAVSILADTAADYDRLNAEQNMELALLRTIDQIRRQARR